MQDSTRTWQGKGGDPIRLQTFTQGPKWSVKIFNRLSLDLDCKRYEMGGQDHRASANAIHKANTLSARFRLRF